MEREEGEDGDADGDDEGEGGDDNATKTMMTEMARIELGTTRLTTNRRFNRPTDCLRI